MGRLILGTRGSDLALRQTQILQESLAAAGVQAEIEIRIVTTSGDRRSAAEEPTSLDPGVGLFTRELEEALRRGEIDAAVHSLKDLPVDLAPDFLLGAVMERAQTADVLISRTPGGVQTLPPGARVGTGSPRRATQLTAIRPDLQISDFRGNVPTRLRKLATQPEFDAIVLAQAGLERLGLFPPTGMLELEGVTLAMDPIPEMLPAPGQGAVAIEIRAADAAALATLSHVHHAETADCTEAERNLLRLIGGGCQLPLGALARREHGAIRLRAILFEPGRTRPRRADVSHSTPAAAAAAAFDAFHAC